MSNHSEKNGEGLFIVVSAPSGTGKTSICKEVLRMCPDLEFSTSYTTRPPRPGEMDGRDYHFITDAIFREHIEKGEFAEWAENYGYFYGTSQVTMKAFQASGRDLMLDVEPAGARALKDNFSSGVFVFILPPSVDALKARLLKRGFEKEEAIQRRLQKAASEIQEVFWYDYVIFNDDLDAAIDRLRSIYIAEKSRRDRLESKIRGLFK